MIDQFKASTDRFNELHTLVGKCKVRAYIKQDDDDNIVSVQYVITRELDDVWASKIFLPKEAEVKNVVDWFLGEITHPALIEKYHWILENDT